MFRENVNQDLVYAIHDFLSADECNEFIQMAEKLGFGDAPITTSEGPVMLKDVRNNSRAMKDDYEIAERLWLRAKT